jgi:2-iminobutanoate/2-iminopropanoate deaminase
MRTRFLAPRSALLGVLLLASACTAPAPYHLPAEGALGPYSAAVSSGDFVFLSGKIGKTGGTIGQDVDAAIDALVKDLGRMSLSLADVVSVNVYVTDMGGYADLNLAYAKRFPQPFPARTTVAVSALPGGAKVEIQAVAVRRKA